MKSLINLTGRSFEIGPGRALALTFVFAITLFAGAGAAIATYLQAPMSTLKVQYRVADPNAPGDNQIKAHLNVVNTGTAAVPLSELTIRYWYTNDGSQPQVYDCDWAMRGCANITARFVSLPAPVTGANTYLELAFSAGAGSLAPGQQSGEVQTRLHNQNWSNYTEGNDYSYDATKTSFADWNRITLYRNGTLVWGSEPIPSSSDTQPPTAPATLAVASKTSTSVSLTWTASTDNVGVTGYRILEGATQVGTSAATSFTVTGLTPSTTHTYTVRAVDAAGNVSANSNAVTVTTDPAMTDTQPPTAPATLAVASKTGTSVSLTWTASTDNVGVTGYRILEGATQVGTSAATSFTVTGLTPSTTHTYTVRAVDAAGNVSANSNAVSVTTDAVVAASLRVQYRAADTNATDNQIKPHLNIINTGTTAVPMSELTVRYWYTRDGNQTQVYDCDHAARGCANVTARFGTPAMPVATADTYLELGFGAGAGSLAPGQQSGEMQNRLHNQNWTSYNETNPLPQWSIDLGIGARATSRRYPAADSAYESGRHEHDLNDGRAHVDGIDRQRRRHRIPYISRYHSGGNIYLQYLSRGRPHTEHELYIHRSSARRRRKRIGAQQCRNGHDGGRWSTH
jgi:chitodextrinase